MILRKRIRQCVEYYDLDTWQDTNENPFPAVIFVCPDERSKKYVFKQIQKQLDEGAEINFYLITWLEIRNGGVRAETLHEVLAEE